MTTQQELELKLAAVTNKLKIVCESYRKLKQKLKGKDEEIENLKFQLQKYTSKEETKENSRIQEIRKKYQMQATFRPIEKHSSKLYGENYEPKTLKNVKSLSPIKFSLYQSNEIENQEKKDRTLLPQANPKQSKVFKADQASLNISLSNLRPTFSNIPSVIELEKSREKSKDLSQIDRKYARQSRDHRQKQAQELILRQLWQQRDKQIKRMDDLFQSLNKRIYGSP